MLGHELIRLADSEGLLNTLQVALANLLDWSSTALSRPNLTRWYPRPNCLRYDIVRLNSTLTRLGSLQNIGPIS
jgi:hypothetical protein